ncbi:hypothetical protein [Pseudophaeobacter flagellatus]|uniref:hypothetical protein n=1 Tax=Pseudophaeobacter flagellatus TaxID=2899119 RepID=UPI001E52A74F|nr:hypothetical protein [Pseudophaeobacter flagellatus]MCD9147863.1 hypothetical protein [Pseudophaeobacter flagellatus]
MYDVALEALEAATLNTPPSQVANLPAPIAERPTDAAPQELSEVTDPPRDLMTPTEFGAMWKMAHHMGGALISKRINARVELAEAASNEIGDEACAACYELAEQYAPWMLDKAKGTIGKIMAVGMHGYMCLQMVREAQSAPPAQQTEFNTQRAEA